jgi:hypothetical protein
MARETATRADLVAVGSRHYTERLFMESIVAPGCRGLEVASDEAGSMAWSAASLVRNAEALERIWPMHAGASVQELDPGAAPRLRLPGRESLRPGAAGAMRCA